MVSRLVVHRSERADALVEALGDILSDGLPDPMQAEVISVPTRGVERWLTQRLSGRLGTSPGRTDGVCANVEFPFPGRLIGGAVAAASGVGRDADPWLPERAIWPLLDLLDECIDEPWLATVAGHLGGTATTTNGHGPRRSRRFTTARHVTDLYDRYAVHRPGMLRAWATGSDVDGAGIALTADAAWQAELWRRLRHRIATPGPAERLDDACARLGAQPDLVLLPERISIFGLTRLPASYLQVLRALAVHRDVHLFLLHPSPALWDRTAAAAITGGIAGVVRRRDDPTADLPRHPLLASWGRDAREMQLVLAEGRDDRPAAADEHRPVPDSPPDTLLRRIQDAIRTDRPPPGEPLPGFTDERPHLDPTDRSVQVHACHGRVRQVEVLRDAILHLLVDDPSLEPRDVIVMCPDIEAFAPLIHATFGAGDTDADPDTDTDTDVPAGAARPPDLRVRLADRSLRQTNAVLGAVSNLLVLADARVTASQVLDFAGRDPVRRRFRLDDDDLARIEEWVAATGIRWGFDGPHRAPFKLEAVEENTWRTGLDRVLVGVAMADEDQRLVGHTLPLDDVESSSIELVGRAAELVDRLQSAVRNLTGPMTVAAWADAIAIATDSLTVSSENDVWQRTQLQGLLDDVVAEATVDGVPSDAQLQLSEVRSLFADRLRGQPTRANFRTGHLTICTLVPMRSVPHRVVCLLGLDDGAFPRRTERDGDDLVLADPHVGDRDSSSEDRQLLLDALLAATDRLVITYAGRDERTNAERPPAVPVGELLDVVDRTVRIDGPTAAATPARERIVVHHPLQPFDGRNFMPGRLVPTRPWSFDAVTLDGARALAGERTEPTPFLAAALPPPAASADLVELDLLVKFVQHPVKAFLRQRLGISVGDWSEDIGDAIPVEVDALEQWGVGDRILEARLAGAGMDACLAAERARGLLPPGALSVQVLARISAIVEGLLAATAAIVPAGEPDSVEVSVRLDDGRLLVGTVPGVIGTVSRNVTYSRVAPKHRLTAWARYLALVASEPDAGFEVVTVGRLRSKGKSGRAVTVARLPPSALDGATARRHLHDLVALYERGLCGPLPVYCATSAAYANAVAGGKDGAWAARSVWESGYMFAGEDKNPEHQLVLGGVPSFDDLLVALPCPGEDGDGWYPGESSRFGRYARRLWSGLLTAETVTDR
ncbi:MAG: exodeoxyribonuclease gamma subunit [Actinomycetota bacterium]|jgi:exodeoxyribonuclease V gamma subunit|nr:exodeoxyribonuclease gamma subunit [Actinomycetota bacterium]